MPRTAEQKSRPCPRCGGTDRFYYVDRPRNPDVAPYWRCNQDCGYAERDGAEIGAPASYHIDAPEAPLTPERYAHEHGLTLDTLARYGCSVVRVQYDQQTQAWVTDPHGHEAIRFPDGAHGRLRFMQPSKWPPKWAPERKGQTPAWFGLDTSARLSAECRVIVNGHSSVIACQEHGLPAITIPGGEGSIATQLQRGLLAKLQEVYPHGEIVVMLDGDSKGRQSAPAVGRVLSAAGYHVHICDPGDQMDAADFVRLHNSTSREALAQLIAGQQAPVAEAAPRTKTYLHWSETGQIPPTPALIPDIIYRNKLHQLFAPGGSGKSYLALDMASTIAQFGPVMYVAGEAVEDYPPRLVAWQRHQGRDPGQLYLWPKPVDLTSETSVGLFLAEVAPLGLVFIVFDPLIECLGGKQDDDGAVMSQAIAGLNHIRRSTTAAVLIVHHTGWNEGRERGHSSLRNACRIVMGLQMADDGLITLSCVKRNVGRPFDPRHFRLIVRHTDETGEGEPVLVPAARVLDRSAPLTRRQLSILEALTLSTLSGGANHSQLKEYTGILSGGELHRAVSGLHKREFISWDGPEGRKVWHITEEGRKELEESWKNAGTSGTNTDETLNWSVVLPGSSNIVPASERHSSNLFHHSSNLPTDEPEATGARFWAPPAPPTGGAGVPKPAGDGPEAAAEGCAAREPESLPDVDPLLRLHWPSLRRYWRGQQLDAIRLHLGAYQALRCEAEVLALLEAGKTPFDDEEEGT